MPAPPPLLGVIPTVILAGPAALLAALFPAAFAGLALFWRRWGYLLAAISINSTLLFLHGWLRGYAQGAWWGTPQALWLCLAGVSVAGALLSCRRAHQALRSGQAQPLAPGRIAFPALLLATIVGIGSTALAVSVGIAPRRLWRDFFPLLLAVGGGAFFLLAVRWAKRPAAALGAEAVMLTALGAGCAAVAIVSRPASSPQIVWTFEAVERGVILSSPLVAGDRVYVAAAQSDALNQFGTLYCLDRLRGKMIWSFNNGGKMKQVFSSPALANGRIFIGEGLHEDVDCRLFCLDAATGRELWSFATKSHTESSPRLANGCVTFGAGDDGVYCLEQESGALRWHFPGPHVDTTPTIVGDRLYAGSGYGTTEMFCLDVADGKLIWRTDSDLPVFGSAVVIDGQVFFGLGNGKLTRSAPKPAGALVCLDAATGATHWRYDVGDAVLSSPALVADSVIFCSRDHHCYCLARHGGGLRWKTDLGSPVVAAPVVAVAYLYALGSGGVVHCLAPADGSIVWRFDVGKHFRGTPEMVATPALTDDNGQIRLYVGLGLDYSISSAAVLCCLGAPEE